MAGFPGRIALLVGGGPAPGINGVISSVTLESLDNGIEVIGLKDGFKWLARGEDSRHQVLTVNDVKGIHLRGGSILGTSRTNPAKSEKDMANVLEMLRKLKVSGLITIGGDDTAYSASQVYKKAAAPFVSPMCPRPSIMICLYLARRRLLASKRLATSASALSAIWPRMPAPRRAGI